jgi:uncharacterized cofD-like protein
VTLRALRPIASDLTAIVTVADDGGSSGRLREEFGIIPPGDLRMALAALCDDQASGWGEVIQHRFHGSGPLAGHAVGNLLLAALWELHDDPVAGLDAVAALLHARGRVLPMAAVPLSIRAEVRSADGVSTVRGQVAVATAPGEILSIALEPTDPPARPEALAAIDAADWITLGPGSWYSSVVAHLLVPEQLRALCESRARKVLILNVVHPGQDVDETRATPADAHFDLLVAHAPDLPIDVVLADRVAVRDPEALRARVERRGATLVLGDMSTSDGVPTHDPVRLSEQLAAIMCAPPVGD